VFLIKISMISFPVLGLSVQTLRGVVLGKVVNIEVDELGNEVARYYVSRKRLVSHLLHVEPDFIISRDQVVSVSVDKVIVIDLEIGETVDAGEALDAPSSNQHPVGVSPLSSTHQKST